MQQRSGGNTRRPTVTIQQKKVPQNQNQTSRNQGGQRNNQLPVDTRRISNEINPPEILSAQDAQLRRKKQQKDKSKESRTSKLTGDVDLGRNFLKKNLNKQTKSRRRQESRTSTVPIVTTSTTTTTESPNSISQIYPVNPHRHNHYNSNNNNNDDEANNRRIDKSSRREDTYRNQQSYSTVSTMTANSGNIYNTTTELTASKQIEKV